MGIIYPIFFIGSVVIAIGLFYLNSQKAHGVQQLVVTPDYNAVLNLVPNVTQQLLQQANGSFKRAGAA